MHFNKREKLIIGVNCGVMIVSIVCAVGVLVSRRNHEQESIQAPTFSSAWCLPCNLLAKNLNHQTLETINRTKVDGVETCCAHSDNEVSALLDKMISEPENKVKLPTFDAGNFSLGSASAHRRLTVSTFKSVHEPIFLNENMNLEFDTSREDKLTEHSWNVKVMTTAMVIEQPGMYFIYSMVFFKPDSTRPCKDLEKQTWEHNILLTRNYDEEHSGIIFSTEYTCNDNEINSKETSYAGGVFELHIGDRLHVEVSSDGVVRFNKESSYFGLFMIK